MDMKILQKGFNYSQDGPGNRLVYHLQGCNLHCPWCSNPESMQENGSLLVKGNPADKSCPYGAIENNFLNRQICANCLTKECTYIPGSNLCLSCTVLDIDEVFNEIIRSSLMYFDGGGVTFTGGEPTLQFESLQELLIRLKKSNINTAVETNGTHIRLADLYQFIDYLIIDCKHYRSDIHKRVTGVGNKIILDNIRIAAETRSQLLVRIPLINHFNSSVKDAEEFAAFFGSMNTVNCSFELLRYHEYGKDKWEQCGMIYEPKDAEVSDDAFEKFRNIFISHNLNLIKT